MRSTFLEYAFPALRTTTYDITSPATEDYNCIAYAAEVTDKKWWPHPDYYWPPGRPTDNDTVDNFIETFQALGYEVCADGELEAGYEKLAIYADGTRTKHMARQIGRDLWTSKLGDERDITHTLAGLEGQAYGLVARFLRRPQNT